MCKWKRWIGATKRKKEWWVMQRNFGIIFALKFFPLSICSHSYADLMIFFVGTKRTTFSNSTQNLHFLNVIMHKIIYFRDRISCDTICKNRRQKPRKCQFDFDAREILINCNWSVVRTSTDWICVLTHCKPTLGIKLTISVTILSQCPRI